MTRQQRRRRFSRRDDAQTRDLDFRVVGLRAATIDEKGRTVEARIATEQAVPMFDWQRGEVVPEVLLASGVKLPGRGGQVPFLNAHARYSVDSQLGSARDLATADDEVRGVLHFSAAAESAWTKVREGHITDVSAGYQVLERTYIPRGETAMIAGREFSGPVNVVTSWKLREVSLVPIGADDQAKLRGYDPALFSQRQRPSKGAFTVDEELRLELEDRGMPKGLSDADAQKWLKADLKERAAKKAAKKAAKAAKQAARGDGGKKKKNERAFPLDAAGVARLIADGTRQAIAEERTRQQAWRAEVDSLCNLGGIRASDDLYALDNPTKVREAIIERRAKAAPEIGFSGPMLAGDAQLDKHRGAAGTALTLRCLEAAGASQASIERAFPKANYAAGWESFRYAGLIDFASECLRMDGLDPRGLTREQIAIAALGWPAKTNVRGDRSLFPAYHTTGSFPKLTQDAINKSMMMGYAEYQPTWRIVGRQGTSAADFKQIHRMRIGAVPNAPIWPDNTEPQDVSFADADEPYAVEAYSERFSLSYRLMVNDDMDVLSRMPFLFGTAMQRTVNTGFWAQITGNPVLGDGQTLFRSTTNGNRKQVNSFTGVNPPSSANLQTLRNALMQMRGENTPEGAKGPDILNLVPYAIVGPSALDTAILQLVKSPWDISLSTAQFQAYNPASTLIPVIEPLLDANSTVAWYVWASPAQTDTVEVTFLQGQETPVTRDYVSEETLSHSWAVLQTFACKALQWRGITKQVGA